MQREFGKTQLDQNFCLTPESEVSERVIHKEVSWRVERRGGKVDGTKNGLVMWTHSVPKCSTRHPINCYSHIA